MIEAWPIYALVLCLAVSGWRMGTYLHELTAEVRDFGDTLDQHARRLARQGSYEPSDGPADRTTAARARQGRRQPYAGAADHSLDGR